MGDDLEPLESLQAAEAEMYAESIKTIRGDETMRRHIVAIVAALDLLHIDATLVPKDEAPDAKSIRLLGIRLFNGCASAFSLLARGYAQVAVMVMRDLLETVFLLGYFHMDPPKIAVWRAADTATRLKEFGPGKLRAALDKRDGFTSGKRKDAYRLLSELGSHPTEEGFAMLAPGDLPHHSGPFFDEGKLAGGLAELAKLALQSAQAKSRFSDKHNVGRIKVWLNFLEVSGRWSEHFFGRPYDPKQVEEVKALLAQADTKPWE